MTSENFQSLEKTAPRPSNHWKPRRDIARQAVVLATVIATGPFSRSHFAAALPHLLTKAAGDAMWTTMVFVVLGLLWPRARTLTLAIAAFAVSAAVEFSQLYQADWISSIRATFPGGAILGFGFHATDFLWYALGTALGVAIDRRLLNFAAEE